MADMFGYVKSFEVERDEQHVLLTCADPEGGNDLVVRVEKGQLAFIADAKPLAGFAGMAQTPTDFTRELAGDG